MQLSIVTVADMRSRDNERTLSSRTTQCPHLDNRTINPLFQSLR